MKIALASPYDYAMHGGVNQHIEHLKREFQKLDHQVVTIAAISEPESDVETPDFHGFGGIVPLPANGSVVRISFSLNLRSRIKQLMEDEDFDVVHCHEPLMPAVPLAVLQYSRSVNIGTFHAYSETGLGYFYWRPVLQNFFKRLDGLVAVSEPAKEYANQFFPGDYTVIPNGVDTEAFERPAEPIPFLMDGRPNILFLGRFEEERKGFRYALRALPWIKEVYPNVRLVVVGRGDPTRYHGRIFKYGLGDNVYFAGPVSDEDRARYMTSCQLLVAPNTGSESQGIVLLEAMAAGLPVIGTNIPGYASVLKHGEEGFLVRPESQYSLAIAITRLLADGAARQYMSERGRAKASQYSWPRVAAQVLEYYAEVCDRKQWENSRADRRKHLQSVMRKTTRA